MHTHLQSMRISSATVSEKPALARLLQLYLHDFSQFAVIGEPYREVGDNGSFPYEPFESYWGNQRREPVLFRIDEKFAGFALVNDWSASGLPTDYSMAEFFVLRKYRRNGIGTRAAIEIIRSRKGAWEIPVADYNHPALAFWRSVADALGDYRPAEIIDVRRRWKGTIWRLSTGVREGEA